jgi:arabinogalactan endo-1,4-beta-galactosidase
MSDDEDGAYYDPINMLDLKVSAIATPYDKQVVVHEATHAALDGMRLLSRADCI